MKSALGTIIRSFVEDHLKTEKGLLPASIRSYRDALRLFLTFVASDAKRHLTHLVVADLTFDRALRFLRYLEESRGNHARTYNHRLAVVRTLFEYLASRFPDLAATSGKVASIPLKEVPPPRTGGLDRKEISSLFRALPRTGKHALRDGALVLFLYNTGAGVQEVVDLRAGDLDLRDGLRVQLNGKSGKRRECSLWAETASVLGRLLLEMGATGPEDAVFCSRRGIPLTRFGIYKILRRHASIMGDRDHGQHRVRPQAFRRKDQDLLLDTEVGAVIRSWLGRVDPGAADPRAELPCHANREARRPEGSPSETSTALLPRGEWKDDMSLLNWLNSL
jgi:integrase/recombinase XerD